MKKILLSLFLFAGYFASGQVIIQRTPYSTIPIDQNLYIGRNLKIPIYPDTTTANLWMPKDSLGLFIQIASSGVVYHRDTTDGGHKWSLFPGSSGAVNTVFGRDGDVVATGTDYSAYYPLLSGAYDNPSWINSLPASKISSAGNVVPGSSKIVIGGTPSGAALQNFSIDVNQANFSLSALGGLLNIGQINATGTPSSSTVLYGDGSWGAAGGSGSGSPNSNVGTGYRLAIPTTNNIKTLFARGYAVLDSSSNTNGITIFPDTGAFKLATKTDLTAYLKLSDTTTRNIRSTGWNDLRYAKIGDGLSGLTIVAPLYHSGDSLGIHPDTVHLIQASPGVVMVRSDPSGNPINSYGLKTSVTNSIDVNSDSSRSVNSLLTGVNSVNITGANVSLTNDTSATLTNWLYGFSPTGRRQFNNFLNLPLADIHKRGLMDSTDKQNLAFQQVVVNDMTYPTLDSSLYASPGLDSLIAKRIEITGAGVTNNSNGHKLSWAINAGFTNPMDAAGQLIFGGTSGTPTKTATPGHAGMKPVWNGTAVVWGDTTAGGGGFSDPLTTNNDIIARISGSTTRLPGGSNGTYLGVRSGALGYFAPSDAELSTSDITTNNASTSKHGFLSKLPNDATKYQDGTGNWSVPAGSGGGISGLTAGRIILSTSSTTVGDDAGLTYNSSLNALTTDTGFLKHITLNGSTTDPYPLNILPNYNGYGGIMIMNKDTTANGGTSVLRIWGIDSLHGLNLYHLSSVYHTAPDVDAIYSQASGGLVLGTKHQPIYFETNDVGGGGADFTGVIWPGMGNWNIANESTPVNHYHQLFVGGAAMVDSFLMINAMDPHFATIQAGDYRDQGYSGGVGFQFRSRKISSKPVIFQLDSSGVITDISYNSSHTSDGFTTKAIFPDASGVFKIGDMFNTAAGSRNGGGVMYWSPTLGIPTSGNMNYDSANARLMIGKTTNKGVFYVHDSILMPDLGFHYANLALWNYHDNANYVEGVGWKFWTVNSTSQRFLGFVIDSTGDITPGGRIKGAASSAIRATLNIPSGTAPTSPNNGDLWYNSSSNILESRINGITLSNGFVSGQTTLVSGTKAITITGLTTSSKCLSIVVVTPSGTSLTTAYQGVCTANTLTLQANISAGTINTADGTVVNYQVQP